MARSHVSMSFLKFMIFAAAMLVVLFSVGVSCKQWCPGTCQQYPKGKCEAFCKANGYQIGKCVPPENAFCCCAKIGDQIFN
ncbi:hypothetical protein JHK82_055738 [Glycine max]|uniref:Uncharacterized protein n=2 Tax=Glycine subgen. Soja TaxID=1462606 RepID=A0A0R0E8D0_SOYBN|nr:hypothetical protein JHK86_055560 [Glycine max]KAG4909706.1 hypothetical protein JHK87_055822 [Glycine soja]KAG4918284.1 hypothetical protein JHK85_056565 [Glycine max]KAG5074367.1 hypothetical protein JHK84_055598 [Glycine max]KAG5077043.1 hypothetical protein JHK82_055738 [Glycine max]